MRLLRLMAVLAALSPLAGCQTFGGVVSSSPPFASDEDFRQWFSNYYKDPHPERIRAALKFLNDHRYLTDHPEVGAVFFGGVFAQAPAEVAGWLADWDAAGASLSQTEWNVVLVAVWASTIPTADPLLEKYGKHASGEFSQRLAEIRRKHIAPPDLATLEVRDPRQINILWAAFNATGDAKYVRKVVSYIHLYGEDDDPAAAAVGEAAMMSLANNVPQHELVAQICMNDARKNPDQKTRVLLDTMFKILAQIAQEGGDQRAAH